MVRNSGNRHIIMSDYDFHRFSELIYEKCGISLTEAKKAMLTSRLHKRLHSLGISLFSQYYDYVTNMKSQSEELVHMIDAVATNKTDFFREYKHFDYLMKEVLPQMVQSRCWRPGKKLNVWSAGCSSGEEPYTIAMVLAEFISKNQTGDFSVLATDISTQMLKIAETGIYPEGSTESVPPPLKNKYMMRGKGEKKGFCRIVPELRSHIHFQRINLNNGMRFEIKTQMDIVFCRNVVIYFNRETQRKLFRKFYAQMLPGGYLFIGHSETLHGISTRFKPLGTGIYMKPED